tara:strand:+ start:31 stop:498 length:468 start_codon:yes stop_codon:yes gene_type:complete
MATFRHGTPGTMTSSKKIVISDALPSSAGDTDFSLIQPKDTIVDEVFIRILEAPVVASGNIGFTMGYTAAGTEVVGTGVNNLLDTGTTLPVGTIFKISGTAGTAFGDFATGDASSETAHDTLKTADTVLHGRIKTSTAATTAGKLEIHVVFRYFD